MQGTVSDELWRIIEPILSPKAPIPKGGRPRLSDRAALADIIHVLKSDIRSASGCRPS